jgi:hypothetical protein
MAVHTALQRPAMESLQIESLQFAVTVKAVPVA